MAESPVQKAIQVLTDLIREEELNEVATEKIQKLTAELQNEVLPPFNPIEKIEKGFMNFRINQFEQYPWFYKQLEDDQSPHFLVFACSDSRVSPTFILNFIPGKAFMARNIANLVPPYDFDKVKYSGVGAIIEYAITALMVKTILVIGHTRCGGIERLMSLDDSSDTQYDFIDDWVKIATPAKDFVNQHFPDEEPKQKCRRCEKEAVNLSLKNLESYPYVEEGVKEKKVKLLGGYY